MGIDYFIESDNTDSDILIQSKHGGVHCLYYHPGVGIQHINAIDNLTDICTSANRWLDQQEKVSEDFKARLVNINRFAQTLRTVGCVKPVLLQYYGSIPYTCATGGTRLLAIEALNGITTVPAFISTNAQYSSNFVQLEEVTDVARFRTLCNASTGAINLRVNSKDDDCGIEWFEFDSPNRNIRVPSEQDSVAALEIYLKTQPSYFKFDREWFAQPIDWSRYFSNYTE